MPPMRPGIVTNIGPDPLRVPDPDRPGVDVVLATGDTLEVDDLDALPSLGNFAHLAEKPARQTAAQRKAAEKAAAEAERQTAPPQNLDQEP